VQNWIDWDLTTPVQFTGRAELRYGVREMDNEWEWHPEYLGVFSIAQPPHRRLIFLTLGFNVLVFPSSWFMIVLEDYPQVSWALQILEHNWIQAHEWRVRFLSRLLCFVEPRYLCLVFGEAGYPLYIMLHCKRKDSSRRSSPRYAIKFNNDGTIEAKVISRLPR
jgi:hypothetical protein